MVCRVSHLSMHTRYQTGMLWCAVVWCRYGMVWHLHDKSSVSRSGGTCYQLLLHMHLPCTWNVARTFSRSARWRIRGFRTRVWWPQTHSTEDHLCARLVPCNSLRLLATSPTSENPCLRLHDVLSRNENHLALCKLSRNPRGPYGSFWAGLIPQRACAQNHAASFLLWKALNIKSFKHIPKSKQGTNWMRWFKWFIYV